MCCCPSFDPSGLASIAYVDAQNELQVNNTGNNVVAKGGGEWRIQGSAKTYIKVDETAGTYGFFSSQPPSADHHAISRGWVKDYIAPGDFLNKSDRDQTLNTQEWKIIGKSENGNRTHIHFINGETRIYHLQDPSDDRHPVPRGWANNTYATKASVADCLKLSGGTMTGSIKFTGGSSIDANGSNSVLSGRGCLDIKANADRPIIMSSGSGHKPLLAFYGYDNSATDKRKETAHITAGGLAYFQKTYSGGKELATKEYVDQNAGGGGGSGAIANSGNSSNPNLQRGELYFRTTDNTLLIGI